MALTAVDTIPQLLDGVYISNLDACRIIGTYSRRVRKLASAGFIATAGKPGGYTTYRLGDIIRIATGIVTPSV